MEAFDGNDWWPATIVNIGIDKGGRPTCAEVHYKNWVSLRPWVGLAQWENVYIKCLDRWHELSALKLMVVPTSQTCVFTRSNALLLTPSKYLESII